jgi:hypothetical protein
MNHLEAVLGFVCLGCSEGEECQCHRRAEGQRAADDNEKHDTYKSISSAAPRLLSNCYFEAVSYGIRWGAVIYEDFITVPDFRAKSAWRFIMSPQRARTCDSAILFSVAIKPPSWQRSVAVRRSLSVDPPEAPSLGSAEWKNDFD